MEQQSITNLSKKLRWKQHEKYRKHIFEEQTTRNRTRATKRKRKKALVLLCQNETPSFRIDAPAKQQIFEKISRYQGALAILHPTVKAGSLVLADLETVFKKLDEEMLPVGCVIYAPTKERIQEIAREVRELRDKAVAQTSVANR